MKETSATSRRPRAGLHEELSMNAESNESESWTPCRPMALQTYGVQSKKKQRLHVARRVSGGVLATFCVVGLTIWSVGRWTGECNFGGIGCRDVQANLVAYQMGTLPNELSDRIRIHLPQCLECQIFLRQLNRRQVSAAPAQSADCDCSHCRVRSYLAVIDRIPRAGTAPRARAGAVLLAQAQ
jgi:Putative zinc-finger